MGWIMVIILFPEEKENELHEEMKRLAVALWAHSELNTHNKPPEDGHFYFRREATETEPSGILCIYRSEPGRWHVNNVLAEKSIPFNEPMPREKVLQYCREFFATVAGPASDSVCGNAYIRFGVAN